MEFAVIFLVSVAYLLCVYYVYTGTARDGIRKPGNEKHSRNELIAGTIIAICVLVAGPLILCGCTGYRKARAGWRPTAHIEPRRPQVLTRTGRGGAPTGRSSLLSACLVACTVIVGLAACGSPQAPHASAPAASPHRPSPTPSAPPVAYPGHLLLVTADGSLYRLASGSAPVRAGKAGEGGQVDLSGDGRYAVDYNQGTLTTVATGTVVRLPGTTSHDPASGAAIFSADFSPDGSRIAYTIDAAGTDSETGNVLAVYDIATGRGAVILRNPCADYVSQDNGRTVTVCGNMNGVVWLDPAELFVARYTGDLPPQLSLTGYVTADTYSIITATGQLVTNVTVDKDPGISDPAMVGGGTLMFGDSYPDLPSWVSVAALKSGRATTTQSPLDVIEGWSLSPDGTMVVVEVGGAATWEVADTRTGTVRALGTPMLANWNVGEIAWSPDGRWFAVHLTFQQTGSPVDSSGQLIPVPDDRIYVIPVSSTKKGSLVADLSGDLSGASLVGWVP